MKWIHGRPHDDRMAWDHEDMSYTGRKRPKLLPPDDQPWNEMRLRAAVILVVSLAACGAILVLRLFGVFGP